MQDSASNTIRAQNAYAGSGCGYDAPALAVLPKAKAAEVRDFLAGTLPSDRTREFTTQLRMAGVPV
jgi:hypothetical protein